MKWLPRSLGLPLLAKELVEQAARRRTYVVRVAYAAMLFLAFALYFHSEIPRQTSSPYRAFGMGKQMFEFLVWIQFAGIYIFLPAMMSGVLTYEKERRSLELVFLTDLGPWEILLQKYLGRLVPMFTFLLLSLPLMAIAYAFGGISADYLASGVFILLITCLQVGAFALMVSAFCRTTTQAFIASYVLGALFYFFPLLLKLLLADALHIHSLRHISQEVIFAFVPVYVFRSVSRRGFGDTLAHGVPIALSAGAFLGLARVFIVRRAFVPAKSLTLGLFKLIDGVMDRWNRSIGGNVVLVKEKKTLPDADPVAWREVAKKSLGKTRYLIWILFATEMPILFTAAALLYLSDGAAAGRRVVSVMVFILWGLAVLTISVPSANAIASERTKRTLDVLLTTPLEGADIIRQKARAVWRLIVVLMVPFVTLFLIEAWWESGGGSARGELGAVGYVVTSGLAIVIYLPMLSWVSRWIGLRVQSRARAVVATLGGIVAWNLAPLGMVYGVCSLTGTSPESSGLAFLLLLSPATVIPLTELPGTGWSFRSVFHAPAAVPIFLNFLWHGGVLYYFRHLCLKHADRYLGRVGERRPERRVLARLRGARGGGR